MNKLLIVCGPTATGKTAVAIKFAKMLNGELVSADSRQVYREMDIGTGKDKDLIDVPIWMLDVVNPDEEFSVSHYARQARKAIEEIHNKKKLPIVVGGTGLYIEALIKTLSFIDVPPNILLRKKLQSASVSELQRMLPGISMNHSDWNNPRRLIRRIEVEQAPKNVPKNDEISLDYCMVGLKARLSVLFERIDNRVDDRLNKGMREEVTYLQQKYGEEIPSMSAIGYRSLDTWKQDEHRYAKRQLTWFNKNRSIEWYDISEERWEEKMTASVLAWYTKDGNEHEI